MKSFYEFIRNFTQHRAPWSVFHWKHSCLPFAVRHNVTVPNKDNYRPPKKITFSVVSVHELIKLFTGRSHLTITHYALDLTKQGPYYTGTPLPMGMGLYRDLPTSFPGPGSSRLPFHIQTCSLWSTHGWQAGGLHPTGIISWLFTWWNSFLVFMKLFITSLDVFDHQFDVLR